MHCRLVARVRAPKSITYIDLRNRVVSILLRNHRFRRISGDVSVENIRTGIYPANSHISLFIPPWCFLPSQWSRRHKYCRSSCNKRHMSNFRSNWQQYKEANIWICVSSIQWELVNLSDSRPKDLELSSGQIGQVFGRYPISVTIRIFEPWCITNLLGRTKWD